MDTHSAPDFGIRRQAQRISVALPVELERGKGVTRDVSASGVFFETDLSFSPAAPIRFCLVLEHVASLCVRRRKPARRARRRKSWEAKSREGQEVGRPLKPPGFSILMLLGDRQQMFSEAGENRVAHTRESGPWSGLWGMNK
jgi:hypothetical protein